MEHKHKIETRVYKWLRSGSSSWHESGCLQPPVVYILFIWVIVLPFVDSDHVLHKYFLPREYSVILPGVAASRTAPVIGTFIAFVLWKNHRPKKVD
ncbi:dolichol phosphate-mannose biosynthesis regulatory protein [Thalassophryne amazonica]|uniref:dolichol phosphate-mannose biosynthesis regulatory protein n=1 Tax=Thalassophryne amazonica TaxID=390379 RepID=UPI001470913A|nr:dolichol phosphate-mannose biosynthesis regulatory protein [Thalassophryne amazonica]